MNKPLTLSRDEWQEIAQITEIRDIWGFTDETPEQIAELIYGVKFDFVSGGPGYFGDLYILQGDALTGVAPVVLIRDKVLADEDHPNGHMRIINDQVSG